MIRSVNNIQVRCRQCGCDIPDFVSYLSDTYTFWPLCGDCYQLEVYGYIDREPAMRKVWSREGQHWRRPPKKQDVNTPDEPSRRCNVKRYDDATKSPFYPYVREY